MTVYYLNKPIHLVEKKMWREDVPNDNFPLIVVQNLTADGELNELLKKLTQHFFNGAILHVKNGTGIQLFESQFRTVIAGGGLVQRDNKDVLFIYRRKKWDLPKGKIEVGETVEAGAVREVEEETGLIQVTRKQKICVTYHLYKEKGEICLKKTHWYYMTTTMKDSYNVKPQVAEDITSVRWVATKDITKPMKNTYKTIGDVVNTFFDEP